MPTINVSSTSGVVRNTGTTYSTVRTATTGDSVLVGGTSRAIGQYYNDPTSTYFIYRAYLAFDTSGITATPQSATLNIYIPLTSGFDFIVQDASAPDLTTNLASTDYDAFGGAGFGITFTPVEGWNAITLNASALGNMDTNSIFKLSIRGINDYSNSAPSFLTKEII